MTKHSDVVSCSIITPKSSKTLFPTLQLCYFRDNYVDCKAILFLLWLPSSGMICT